MLTHKGGSLITWDAQGNKTGVVHYGKDLNRSCPDCKVGSGAVCITASGKPLKKTHVARRS